MERLRLVIMNDDGEIDEVYVELTQHAVERAGERFFSEEEIASLVQVAGPRILALRLGERFQILTDDGHAAIVCQVWSDEEEYMITISVITTIRRNDGRRVFLDPTLPVIAV